LPSPNSAGSPPEPDLPLNLLRPYQTPIFSASLWQIASTFGLYIACTVAMYFTSQLSILLTLALAIPTSGLIVRIFMLQHDCGHNAMFRSRRLNMFSGALCSFVTFTPFAYWRRLHARHHGSWNNLDGRGIPADFFSDCATVAEYAAMTRMQKGLYRFVHHPLLAHFVLPPIIFILLYRLPFDTPATCERERHSVYMLDLAIITVFGALIALFGIKTVLLVHLPSMVLASIIGIWLFSVQHRFEQAQWVRKVDWHYTQAALRSTSYLNLPPVLQWFSGNIGLHHVHHLSPNIPNYRLQACHDACAVMTGKATEMTLKQALGASSYALWDESLLRMVPFPG
jgi:acyl-lipid omega-6 desaturase (Delta-12 desaturase)